jgi:hypothetical protein
MSEGNGAGPAGFDLASYRAAQAEVTHQTFPVRLGTNDDGTEAIIEFPELRQWPLEAQEVLGRGDVVNGLIMLVGQDQAERFRAFHWTFGEFEALFEALSTWSGFEMGQPSARPPALGLTRRSS